MTKLNKTFFIVGLLLWAGGILLIIFPAVMKYVFSIISVLSGTHAIPSQGLSDLLVDALRENE